MSVLEVKHQMFLKRDLQFRIETASQIYTEAEVQREVKAGRFLVILNEMVLDVGEYCKHHPGGQFVL